MMIQMTNGGPTMLQFLLLLRKLSILGAEANPWASDKLVLSIKVSYIQNITLVFPKAVGKAHKTNR